jgi:diacylglycerol kinase (ATP)
MNPNSGRQTSRQLVDDLLGHLIDAGELARADINYTRDKNDAFSFARDTSADEFDLILVVGGDGTAHDVVNGLMDSGSDIPLAIFAGGTVNDFATYIDLPTDPYTFSQMLISRNTVKVDLGRVGKRHFLNVLAGGMLTDIAYKVPADSKALFGRFAYWFEGAIDLPSNMKAGIPITVKSEDTTFTIDAMMFIISNSKNVGGVRKLLPHAEISDGLLDVLVIPKLNTGEFLPLLGKVLLGDHLSFEKVRYFQTKKVRISTSASQKVRLDLDGEEGPFLPVTIECLPKALTLIVPVDYDK